MEINRYLCAEPENSKNAFESEINKALEPLLSPRDRRRFRSPDLDTRGCRRAGIKLHQSTPTAANSSARPPAFGDPTGAPGQLAGQSLARMIHSLPKAPPLPQRWRTLRTVYPAAACPTVAPDVIQAAHIGQLVACKTASQA